MRPWILSVSLSWLLLGSASAQVSVALSEVPANLSFPLPDGANLIVSAKVTGGEVRSVWMAHTADSRLRVALDRRGDGVYQVNLASADVQRFLRNGSGGGEFAIHAEVVAGGVVSSVPVRYRWTPDRGATPTYRVYTGKDWEFRRAVAGRRAWFPAHRVTRLEWSFGLHDRIGKVVARAGDRDWRFLIEDDSALAVLELTDAIRLAWEAEGALEIDAPGRAAFPLRARPRDLDLPAGRLTITVEQRRRAEVPGSGGFLSLRIGDITHGQTLVELIDAERRLLIPKTSMRQGQELPFTVGDRRSYLTASRLVNYLIGDDFGEFTIATKPADHRQDIAALLERIERADVVFLRNDTEHDGAAAAEHLRRKLETADPPVKTADEFIERIASRSSSTGKLYRVRVDGGLERTAAAWFRDQLLQVRRERRQAANRRDV